MFKKKSDYMAKNAFLKFQHPFLVKLIVPYAVSTQNYFLIEGPE